MHTSALTVYTLLATIFIGLCLFLIRFAEAARSRVREQMTRIDKTELNLDDHRMRVAPNGVDRQGPGVSLVSSDRLNQRNTYARRPSPRRVRGRKNIH